MLRWSSISFLGVITVLNHLTFLKKKKKAACISPVLLFNIPFHFSLTFVWLQLFWGSLIILSWEMLGKESQIEQIASDPQSVYLSGFEIQEGHWKVWARIYVIFIRKPNFIPNFSALPVSFALICGFLLTKIEWIKHLSELLVCF